MKKSDYLIKFGVDYVNNFTDGCNENKHSIKKLPYNVNVDLFDNYNPEKKRKYERINRLNKMAVIKVNNLDKQKLNKNFGNTKTKETSYNTKETYYTKDTIYTNKDTPLEKESDIYQHIITVTKTLLTSKRKCHNCDCDSSQECNCIQDILDCIEDSSSISISSDIDSSLDQSVTINSKLTDPVSVKINHKPQKEYDTNRSEKTNIVLDNSNNHNEHIIKKLPFKSYKEFTQGKVETKDIYHKGGMGDPIVIQNAEHINYNKVGYIMLDKWNKITNQHFQKFRPNMYKKPIQVRAICTKAEQMKDEIKLLYKNNMSITQSSNTSNLNMCSDSSYKFKDMSYFIV